MRRETRCLILVASALLPFAGCLGEHEVPGEVTEVALPREVIANRSARQESALHRLDAWRGLGD